MKVATMKKENNVKRKKFFEEIDAKQESQYKGLPIEWFPRIIRSSSIGFQGRDQRHTAHVLFDYIYVLLPNSDEHELDTTMEMTIQFSGSSKTEDVESNLIDLLNVLFYFIFLSSHVRPRLLYGHHTGPSNQFRTFLY